MIYTALIERKNLVGKTYIRKIMFDAFTVDSLNELLEELPGSWRGLDERITVDDSDIPEGFWDTECHDYLVSFTDANGNCCRHYLPCKEVLF